MSNHLHLSLDVVADWPQAAPLTEAEVRQHIDTAVLPLLRIMMLVDNDAWSLLDPPTKQQYRRETLAVFQRMESDKIARRHG